MGRFDGASCEVICILLQHELCKIINKNYIVLYSDDALIFLRICKRQRKKKIIIRIFKNMGFCVEIKSNLL